VSALAQVRAEHDLEPDIPSAWPDGRALFPAGTVVMRVINHERRQQEFVAVQGDGDVHKMLDGATQFVPPLPREASMLEYGAIEADYDRLWHDAAKERQAR
jgi:hypothetical protein